MRSTAVGVHACRLPPACTEFLQEASPHIPIFTGMTTYLSISGGLTRPSVDFSTSPPSPLHHPRCEGKKKQAPTIRIPIIVFSHMFSFCMSIALAAHSPLLSRVTSGDLCHRPTPPLRSRFIPSVIIDTSARSRCCHGISRLKPL